MSVTILAIESSCDETAAAVARDGQIISNCIANQTIHEKYGGVVPELASRAHLQHIVPVVHRSLAEAFPDLSPARALQEIDAFAFTAAPGLIGSLLVGAQFAKSLALSLNKPLLAVHHMQAHVLANLLGNQPPSFPFLCLTVSGGHTQLVLAKAPLDVEILGETIDDAAGEAFDKIAKLLGLPYPGGPLVDQHARSGNPLAFSFAQPKVPGLNFSFSGLKTSVLYFLQKQPANFIANNLSDLCASVQHTIVTMLLRNLKKAVEQTGVKEVCIAGGVSANSALRKSLQDTGASLGWSTHIPDFAYCTDNAAMIAITGYYQYLNSQFANYTTPVQAVSDWSVKLAL
ncbi:MAG: tRNA (adenosine(37)-N6)-threonylcarbamoyltransferase complex transferase subunit TsaD [Chitinophagaceae bacterium]|nr:tRNA (adenosine(37)-N6)-threonylcarbamoyltransferase complex transferase subunit TsaD [Chitinophagaceae bacterium]MCA6471798.1 tRNA (adenosine(37)-N6)-threonylcarbamoyltransferase complex transferase subunit TsaD [Chitinophagaceae bacterium]MCA6477848.1 tRNA (adenosine(37)-N6)-threonylcarbamoyltransferase complex transferase subunit TsaD [Chitinophagaceae bacterium]MCA6480663.1 tRNA (adenosine(37)-N6)-threonylcarbamoyltransferase complex transferase subunit TsaD [Chitinophagaceae bacterium]M